MRRRPDWQDSSPYGTVLHGEAEERVAGILERGVHETPIAVVDFETTGLSAGWDRVVEVSVVRVEPGEEPRLALDTLVNPRRQVGATFIHGITDSDVADAPAFEEVAGDFVRALSGAVVAAWNVYFDMSFLRMELARAGVGIVPPHFCLMYMRQMLGIGRHCRLGEACRAHGIPNPRAHSAGSDALVSARILGIYLERMREEGILTWSDLAGHGKYKFVSSWLTEPLDCSCAADRGRAGG